MNEILNVLEKFQPIQLAAMNTVELMNRIDTKFIFHRRHLDAILNQLRPEYSVLTIDSTSISTYKNRYFDTADLKFYHDHHNGKLNRMKIRMRQYLESNLCYIEVKQKNNKGRTAKKRQKIRGFEEQLSSSVQDFLMPYIDSLNSLQPVLQNEFKRITLVSLERQERVTIDLGITYNHKGNSAAYADLIIVELKQAVFNRDTPLCKILKSKLINPYRVSKYCLGMIALHEELKQNTFKEKTLRIHKITQ